MHVKLIDSSGATTYIECISAVWLGGDREMAEGYDGPRASSTSATCRSGPTRSSSS